MVDLASIRTNAVALVGWAQLVKAKVAHLVFHGLQWIEPESAGVAREWTWMNEAAATAFEMDAAATADYLPLAVRENWGFARNALELGSIESDTEMLGRRGLGAARLARYLVEQSNMRLLIDLCGARDQFLRGADSQKTTARWPPRMLRQIDGDPAAHWKNFALREGLGLFHNNDFSNESDYLRPQQQVTLAEGAGRTVTIAYDAPQLSAQVFEVILPRKWPAGATLTATAAGVPDLTSVAIAYYSFDNTFSPLRAEKFPESQNFERSNPAAQFPEGQRLWVVIVNNSLVTPFTAKTHVEITFTTKVSGSSVLPYLKQMGFVDLRLSGTGLQCTDLSNPAIRFRRTASSTLTWAIGTARGSLAWSYRWRGKKKRKDRSLPSTARSRFRGVKEDRLRCPCGSSTPNRPMPGLKANAARPGSTPTGPRTLLSWISRAWRRRRAVRRADRERPPASVGRPVGTRPTGSTRSRRRSPSTNSRSTMPKVRRFCPDRPSTGSAARPGSVYSSTRS